MPDTILVTGATGNIGSELVNLLLKSGARVRVLTRDREKAARKWKDIQIAVGDLLKPETVAPALEGVEKLFLLGGAPDLPTLTGPVMQAAKQAGVRQVVLNSSDTINLPQPTQIARWHQAAEEQVKASGISWTFLRPGNFASNSLRWAGMIRAQGQVFAPFGDGRSRPIDPRDIASAAHAALIGGGHEGKVYRLNGPELLTSAEQVEIIGKVTGKPLKFVQVPEAGARAGMIQSGMPAAFADVLLELMRVGHAANLEGLASDFEKVTGKKPRTFETWVRDNVAEFR